MCKIQDDLKTKSDRSMCFAHLRIGLGLKDIFQVLQDRVHCLPGYALVLDTSCRVESKLPIGIAKVHCISLLWIEHFQLKVPYSSVESQNFQRRLLENLLYLIAMDRVLLPEGPIK